MLLTTHLRELLYLSQKAALLTTQTMLRPDVILVSQQNWHLCPIQLCAAALHLMDDCFAMSCCDLCDFFSEPCQHAATFTLLLKA